VIHKQRNSIEARSAEVLLRMYVN